MPVSPYPAEFFTPAPTRFVDVPRRLDWVIGESFHAESRLLRITGGVAGCIWFVLVLIGYDDPAGRSLSSVLTHPQGHPVTTITLWTLMGCAVLLTTTALLTKPTTIRAIMVATSSVFIAIGILHAGYLLTSGQSPLAALNMGDYCGVPAMMISAALPPRIGPFVGIFIALVGTLLNPFEADALPLLVRCCFSATYTAPFIIFYSYARATLKTLDDTVAEAQRQSAAIVHSEALKESESQFLGHLHDQVLSALNSIQRTTSPPDRQSIPTTRTHTDVHAVAANATVALSLADFIDKARLVLANTAPDTILHTDTDITHSPIVDALTAAALLDALDQAARNSAVHAPTARRTLNIHRLQPGDGHTGLSLVFSDNGPGFDLAAVPADRAGVRVSIIKRVQSIPGCTAELSTRPGAGTTVTMRYTSDNDGTAHPATIAVKTPGIYELLGLPVVYSTPMMLLMSATFLGTIACSQDKFGAHEAIAMASIIVILQALRRSPHTKLPPVATAVAAIGTLTFFTAGLLSNTPIGHTWPEYWYVSIFPILVNLIAFRHRPFTGLATVGILLAEIIFLRATTSLDIVGPIYFLKTLPVILAGMFVPYLINKLTRALPVAYELAQRQTVLFERHLAHSEYLAHSNDWLIRLLDVAFNDAFTPEQKIANARLLELRLRDSIRCPHLDTAPLTQSIWLARARGVNVTLLDDLDLTMGTTRRRNTLLDDTTNDHLQQFITTLIDTLNHAPNGTTITARIYPQGRDKFGTIVSDEPNTHPHIHYRHTPHTSAPTSPRPT
ncbi:hypothetical protein [Corynebacterium aquilae]|uniref:Histidine kinase/HSP90-like ATPase domain-containing protein n=1 Tax=Corynebacterium aquilae DSM 44791 TaxID=1431546 RepID=A0A1L7CET2_9CORY|nr:hypothetical protein [Corynebacterium aquilae]APT84283.1 hypothetical protein CAQU_03480 [Corynebacterium aquilae DSM 44791]